MKSVILTLLLGATSFLPAQSVSWTAPGNAWTYSGTGWVQANRPHQLYVDRDTVIDGLNATILEQRSDDPYSAYNFDAFPYPHDTIIVRQEGDKFYQYLDTAFRVLYDFSLKLGDTVSIYVPVALRNQNPDIAFAVYLVDSVETITVDGRELRGQYWREISSPSYISGSLAGGWRYELLGTVWSYLLPYGGFFCDGSCPIFLRCFSSPGGDGGAGLTYEDPNFPFPCDTVISSLREPDISHLVRIGPNPLRAGRSLDVRLDATLAAEEARIMLIDAAGRQIAAPITRRSDGLTLHLPAHAPSGLYTLVLQLPKGRAALRLVVLPPA
jgi:hypothetical protein